MPFTAPVAVLDSSYDSSKKRIQPAGKIDNA